jgi:hypothetical protein
MEVQYSETTKLTLGSFDEAMEDIPRDQGHVATNTVGYRCLRIIGIGIISIVLYKSELVV